MIVSSEIFKIGKFLKPHGIKGELSFAFDNDIFDRVDKSFLICEIDGIFVPFAIDEYRFRGSESALIILEDIDSEAKAARLTGLDVYFLRKYNEENEEEVDYSWNFFIGFAAIDKKAGELGIIEAIDDKTINTLFLIKKDGVEYIIPATEDFIVEVDNENKILHLDLVDGLIDIEE